MHVLYCVYMCVYLILSSKWSTIMIVLVRFTIVIEVLTGNFGGFLKHRDTIIFRL